MILAMATNSKQEPSPASALDTLSAFQSAITQDESALISNILSLHNDLS
jgi:hypothetical protein